MASRALAASSGEPEPKIEPPLPDALVVVLEPGEVPPMTPRGDPSGNPKTPVTPKTPKKGAMTYREDLGLSPRR